MLEHSKKIVGKIKIFKEYPNSKKELIYKTSNITTIGFSKIMTDLLVNNLSISEPKGIEIGYLQLGTSYHSDFIDRTFYELASPLTDNQYGKYTDLNIAQRDQTIVLEPFISPENLRYVTQEKTFIKLTDENITLLNDDKIMVEVTLDEQTANGVSISESGLFINNTLSSKTDQPILVAYNAFGMNDGDGVSLSIPKVSEFKLRLQWIVTLQEDKIMEPMVFSTSSNTYLNLNADIYLPADTGASAGNGWVCYFANPILGKDPPTPSSIVANPIRTNIQKDFFVRLLNRGVGIISCDYNYPTSAGDYPLMTSALNNNHPVIASSISPLILSGSGRNAYTDAAQMSQFASYISSSVNFNASNVVYAGEGFGGTLAAWLAYAPQLSGATGGTPYEPCSTRALGTASKDATLNWSRLWPFRLGSASAVYDFRPFALPKNLGMSGTIYSEGTDSVTQASSNDYFQGTWATSAIAGNSTFISASASLGYSNSDIDASGNLFWSSIPGLKNSYQFVEIPPLAKAWYSPLYHASGSGGTITDTTWGADVTVGHADNPTTYFHMDYSGSALSGSQGSTYVSQKTWRVLSSTDLVLAATTAEPASGIDITLFSGVGGTEWNSSSFGNTSSFAGDAGASSANSFEDPFFGLDFWSNMSGIGTQATSSVFRYVDPSQARNNVSNFNYPNTNEAALSAKARSNWIIKLLTSYDSWYNQFL